MSLYGRGYCVMRLSLVMWKMGEKEKIMIADQIPQTYTPPNPHLRPVIEEQHYVAYELPPPLPSSTLNPQTSEPSMHPNTVE